jgi:2-amino-4-hydroxy-6-hydroxymethyldihydropteridine diphosphokinase
VLREPVVAYVGLGANLGDAPRAVRDAVAALDSRAGTRVLTCSSLYRTSPQLAAGPDFINAVVRILTTLSAPDLLAVLHQIEAAAGRERPFPNAPRTLDLDLLLYGSGRISSARLTLPHPRMAVRAFVLVPLAEIEPDQVSAAALQAVKGQPISVFQAF